MFFAQDFSAPQGASTWLSVLFWALGGVLCVLKIVDHFKPKSEPKGAPQPFSIQHVPSFADKAETDARFKHVESKIESARIENKTEMEKLRTEATQGRTEIRDDINGVANRIGAKLDNFSLDVANKVGELRGEIKQLGNRK